MTTIVKPTTDNEVGAVAGVMDYEEGEAVATGEEDAEAAEQGTSHCLTTSKKNAKPAKSWKYFALETDKHGVVKNQDTPVCIVGACRMHAKTKHSSISNLYSHLRQHHPKEYEAVRPRESKEKASLRGLFRSHSSRPPHCTQSHVSKRSKSYCTL